MYRDMTNHTHMHIYVCIYILNMFDKARHENCWSWAVTLTYFGMMLNNPERTLQPNCLYTNRKWVQQIYTNIKGLGQRCIFLPILFNIYRETILKELEVLPVFV